MFMRYILNFESQRTYTPVYKHHWLLFYFVKPALSHSLLEWTKCSAYVPLSRELCLKVINLPIIPSSFHIDSETWSPAHKSTLSCTQVPHSNTPLARHWNIFRTQQVRAQRLAKGFQKEHNNFSLAEASLPMPHGKVCSCHKRFKRGPSNPEQTFGAFPPESLRNLRADYTTTHNSFSIYFSY